MIFFYNNNINILCGIHKMASYKVDRCKIKDTPKSTTRAPSTPTTITRDINNTSSSNYQYVDMIWKNTTADLAESVTFNLNRTFDILPEPIGNYKVCAMSINGYIALPLLEYGDEQAYMSLEWLEEYPPDEVDPPPISHLTVFGPPGTLPANPLNNIGNMWSPYDLVIYTNNALGLLWERFQQEAEAIGVWDVQPQRVPFIEFNPETQLFTMYFDPQMDNNATYYAKLNFGAKFYSLFLGLSSTKFYNTGPRVLQDGVFYVELLVDQGPEQTNIVEINGHFYIESEQDSPSISLWNTTNSIIVASESLPISATTSAVVTDTVLDSTQKLYNLLDSFPVELNASYQRVIVYQNPTRNWVDLSGTNKIQSIRCSLYRYRNDGSFLPVRALPGGTIILRLCFAKCVFTQN